MVGSLPTRAVGAGSRSGWGRRVLAHAPRARRPGAAGLLGAALHGSRDPPRDERRGGAQPDHREVTGALEDVHHELDDEAEGPRGPLLKVRPPQQVRTQRLADEVEDQRPQGVHERPFARCPELLTAHHVLLYRRSITH